MLYGKPPEAITVPLRESVLRNEAMHHAVAHGKLSGVLDSVVAWIVRNSRSLATAEPPGAVILRELRECGYSIVASDRIRVLEVSCKRLHREIDAPADASAAAIDEVDLRAMFLGVADQLFTEYQRLTTQSSGPDFREFRVFVPVIFPPSPEAVQDAINTLEKAAKNGNLP